MTEPIHRQLHALRRSLRLHQYQVAATMGVGKATISAWDRGTKSPSVPHANAYARTVHHRLIVTIDGVIHDLVDLLPNLPSLRQARRVSQRGLARLLWMSRGAVAGFEMRIRAGDAVRLAMVEAYLRGLGCEVGLVPASGLERAA